MRRLEVRYRKSAAKDLANIYFYLRDRGVSPHVARIRKACRRIADAPEGGTSRGDLAAGLRTWRFEGRAVIAYRIEGRVARIVNAFYGGRDIEGFYGRRSLQADEP